MAERIPGKWERLAVERLARDLEHGHERGLNFDAAAADRVCIFFERFLKHHKGEWAGRPFVLAEWQKEHVLRPLFGWRRADGTRRFRTAYIEIPRKNGKTEVAAGIALYLTIADGEAGAEVYSSATKKDQARIMFDAAKAMLGRSPDLRRVARAWKHNIHVQDTGSKFEPLGKDSDTMDGLNPHGNLIDELHAHKDRGVYDVLVTAMQARRQPLTVMITTAGVYRPESIGWQQHDYATKVLDGSIEDDEFFAFIAAADEGDDWQAEETWRKANPNLDVSVKLDGIRALAHKAKHQPSFQNTFRRLHLNQWTEQTERWIDMDRWSACAGPVDEAELLGLPCFAGLDLSSTTDLSAFVLAFPDEDGGYRLLPRFWLPGDDVLERERRDSVPYSRWAREGWLTLTDGNVIDYASVRAAVRTDAERYGLQEVAFDPWNATQLATQLMEDDGVPMVQMRQGFRSMNEPSKEFERLMVSAKLAHGGHPLLHWMAGNVTLRRDPADNIKPDKAKSTGRIDGIVATIMAIGRATLHERQPRSVYEQRGVLTV